MADDNSIKATKKFSLIELLMIIMVVGIIITIIVPLQQNKANREKVKIAIHDIQVIRNANIEFKEDPNLGDGDFAFDISQLNVKTDNTYFTYSLTDSSIVATTNETYGRAGAQIIYELPYGPWTVGGEENVKKIIDLAWLP